jgi:hypothetical protein
VQTSNRVDRQIWSLLLRQPTTHDDESIHAFTAMRHSDVCIPSVWVELVEINA